MKSDIIDIFNSAIKAVMPKSLIENSSYIKTLSKHKIHLFGSGKASVEMAKEMESIFGENIVDGLVISPYFANLKRVEVFESSHPLPSQRSITAAKKLIEKFEKLDEDDLFIYLLSGGTSALIELPQDGLSIDDFIKTTNLLLQNSVPIEDINIIRKQLSKIKGGKLASFTKAKGVVLVISDVIGDDLETIGSAPLFHDRSTPYDAKEVLQKYKLFDKVPKAVVDILKHKSFTDKTDYIEHIIIGSNKIALQHAKNRAVELGYSCEIVTDSLSGDVKIAADKIVSDILKSDKDVLLFGGETTVNVKGKGKGGRNQELCLEVLKRIKDKPNITFLSAGSDGIDGNTKVAGGVVKSSYYHEDIDSFLKSNDSYNFLKREDALLVTGATGTNVMDIMIAMKGGERYV
jgi:hydroxypyruvate reductase/glycerate 2-kinase